MGDELFKMLKLNKKPIKVFIEYDPTIIILWEMFGYPDYMIDWYINNVLDFKLKTKK